MFKSRKGITPLVATVLLVAFSIGLGALVMNWGEDYIEQKAEFVQGTAEVKNACDLAKIDVIRIAGQPQACLADNAVEVWLDNGPDVDLVNIHARIAGDRGVDVVENVLLTPLLKANAARAVIPYKPSIGDVLQLKLTPKIWTGSKVVLCSQSAIQIENLKPCGI